MEKEKKCSCTIKTISTDKAPSAIGPYSQAKKGGKLLFVSGQLGTDPATGAFAGDDLASQAVQAMENLKAIVTAAGLTMDDIVKTTCFISDMNNFAAFNEIYGKYFTAFPARSCVEVSALPKGGLIEVEAIAFGEGE
ncbi:MAG: RidA family protein [Eubacteriaceae bacterium]|nr:RidA family protein [Eubacteriaceae bacterium]